MRTELITNVSHDLKTPLTSMISYMDLLKNKNLPEEERLRYITLSVKRRSFSALILKKPFAYWKIYW